MTQSQAVDARAGAAVYSRPTLAIYDWFVLGFSNRYVWRCPSPVILKHYNQHISTNHLDVGVGTGYFLDKCQFPSNNVEITLADLNENSLAVTAKRLARYKPKTAVTNVLKPVNLENRFDSIGINYLLHCLPGTMTTKNKVFEYLKHHLNPKGIVFGSTILGKGVTHNFLGQRLIRVYNKKGIFSNTEDSLEILEHNLQENFTTFGLEQRGRVALFWGRA